MQWLILSIFLFFGSVAEAKNNNSVNVTGSDSTISYGQLFLKQVQKDDIAPFNIVFFGGQEITSPYLDSSFLGIEVTHKINSLLFLGFEYALYNSKIHVALKSISQKMDLYGLDIKYPFITASTYINWHYYVIKSYLNFAGVFNMHINFPIQWGVGLININHSKMLMALKWGIGSHIHITSRWGVKILLSQSMAVRSKQFLYTWCSINLIYNYF